MSITEGIPGVSLFTDDDARRAENVRSAQGDGRTPQGSLLVMAHIKPGSHYQELVTLLERIRGTTSDELEFNPVIPFRQLRTVHFARILLHPASPSALAKVPAFEGKPQADETVIPAKLLLATDFDGPLEAHLDELLRVCGSGLDELFGHCEGWPGHADREAAHRFFRQSGVRTNTFYTGTQRRTVEQIRREDDLRRRIDDFLDQELRAGTLPSDPVRAREHVRRFVESEPELGWARVQPGPYPTPPIPKFIRDNLFAIIGGGVLVVVGVLAWLLTLVLPWSWLQAGGAIVGVLAAAVVFLRVLESRDPVIVRGTVKDHTGKLVETEDKIVQNEMSSVLYIKRPLWFRGFVLRVVLTFLDFSARYVSVEGRLAGIPSIHFARWVMVDGGRRLVFFSNYDGSWENYLGDFVDKSPGGLTAVWSNCVGFPRAAWLLRGGAADEQLFKAYVRDSQIPTQVWYSAYRWLSVSNINDNSKIRLGLYGSMDAGQAQEWLRRFGGTEKSATPAVKSATSAPTPTPPTPEIAVSDVQGLVARSYRTLRHACYVPVRFGANAAAARAWVDAVRGRVTPAILDTDAVGDKGEALNLAFTPQGLGALGLSEDALRTFSREFIEGMATPHRRRILDNDHDEAEPDWQWGGKENGGVHAMLFLFAGTADGLAALLAREAARGAEHGVTLDPPLDSIMLADDKEHFGFHDGIAQPRIAGLKPDGDRSGKAGPTIPAGEVVLGYDNAYGRKPASPSVKNTDLSRKLLIDDAVSNPFDTSASETRRDLGKNGTYVVFRTLEQDVKTFWRFVDERAGGDAERRKWLAAKMVGRWPNGAPLVWDAEKEPPFDRETADAFLYADPYWDDQHGGKCPVGSHIRRTNPRDGMIPYPAESLKVADRHRLLRRGRAYGPPVADSFDPDHILAAPDERAGQERGLHFICFNTDIARQFEFVQNTWVNGMKFDGLYADPDPLIAPHVDPATAEHPEQVSSFTIQGCPARHRERNLTRFVTMRGGAYLFMPGIKALEYLAKMP